MAWFAGQHNLTAEQVGELSADRQAQPSATVVTRGGAVALHECLEDAHLLVVFDADAGVTDGDGDH